MKALWLGRLARPDIIKAIGDFATQVQKWSRNNDKQLRRLICYVNTSKTHRLVGPIHDDPRELHLALYVDADFKGEQSDARSTSAGYLVLKGPNSFFPLAWVSKRQTSVSRSTTESEIVSLAHSLYQECLPALSLWSLMLGRDNLELVSTRKTRLPTWRSRRDTLQSSGISAELTSESGLYLGAVGARHIAVSASSTLTRTNKLPKSLTRHRRLRNGTMPSSFWAFASPCPRSWKTNADCILNWFRKPRLQPVAQRWSRATHLTAAMVDN